MWHDEVLDEGARYPEEIMKRDAKNSLVLQGSLAAILSLLVGHFAGPLVPVAYAQAAPTAITPAKDYSQAEEHARAVAKELLSRGIPGLAIAVAVDGRIVYSEGFGFADLEERVPVWPTTKFRIGSVSKPLTAVALVQLVEQGKLDLDAPVQKYVP
jgi:serine beta-lactamase-like protein LACTB, mitochondrial